MIDALLTAMAEERGKYSLPKGGIGSLIKWTDGSQVIMKGTRAACEAHLERLVLTAALDRIGAVVVPREPTEAMQNAALGETP